MLKPVRSDEDSEAACERTRVPPEVETGLLFVGERVNSEPARFERRRNQGRW